MSTEIAENSCLNCLFAGWKEAKNGSPHRYDKGVCGWTPPEIKKPKSMWLLSRLDYGGGTISMSRPYVDCPAFVERSNG